MGKQLVIDAKMKELWPATRVGCLQYNVAVEKKNDKLWAYLKKMYLKRQKTCYLTMVQGKYQISKRPGMRTKHLGKIRAVTEYLPRHWSEESARGKDCMKSIR